MKTEIVLDIRGVSKSFGNKKAVDGVNLQVHRGEIYGLIGPNGSGKTTLLKMIVGLLAPDEGEVIVVENRVDGDSIETKKEIGYVPDKPEGYRYLTGMEFIKLSTRLRATPQTKARAVINELVQAFGIESVLRGQIDGYSRGSLQKTAFIAAMAGEPALLVIDEPIAGLDPLSTKVFGKALQKLARDGRSVLFVTHTLAFAEEYATKVGIMVEGKLKKEIESPANIQKIYDKLT